MAKVSTGAQEVLIWLHKAGGKTEGVSFDPESLGELTRIGALEVTEVGVRLPPLLTLTPGGIKLASKTINTNDDAVLS